MPRRANTSITRHPHVALLVETSLAPGRDILRGIARYVQTHTPWALFHEPRSLEDGLPSWLKSWRGDGIIVRVQSARIARAVLATGLPAVDVLGVVREPGLPLVHVDDAAIARMAASHLAERGFHHFAFLGIKGENWSDRRRNSFRLALHLPPRALHVYEIARPSLTRTPWEEQEDALARWLTQLPKPAGVMVCSDQVGQYLLEGCRRAGIQVPDQVAVVGVDNDETLCEICNPPLSSVNAGHQLVGFEAAALLDRLMRRPIPPALPHLVQPQDVVTRQSSDVLATADPHVGAALRLIHELACQGANAAAIIARIPASRSVLQRRFRRETGRSIQDEIINVRLRHACRLLAETDLPLVEIAEQSGFKYQEYLGAVFRARLRKTPGQYRRETTLGRRRPA